MPVGRRRKSLAPRHACGKVVQRYEREHNPEPDPTPTPEIQARRTAIFGSPTASGELECPISILGNRLDYDQRKAARLARTNYRRFTAVILPPRVVAGQLTDFVQGSAAMPILPDDLDALKADYEQLRRAVLREVKYRFRGSPSRAGPISRQAWREVHGLAQGRTPRNLHALRLGLDAIVLHYDLAKAKDTHEEDQREAA